MRKLNSINLVLVCTLTCFSVLTYAASDETIVTQFIPPIPAGKPQVGNCWTSSIAAPRNGAWRCMVGNSIHDPCFATSNSNIVVCDADPSTHTPGFAMQLNAPLPKSSPEHADSYSAWLIKLADGSTCTPFTGTLSTINNQIIIYGCSDSLPCSANGNCKQLTGLLGYPRPGKIWWAQKVTYSVIGGNTQLIKNKTIRVINAWK